MSRTTLPALPETPGVRFRHVPRYVNYMVSDDNKVWMNRRSHWREMKTHKNAKGETIVWLMNDLSGHGEDFVVTELIQQIFGET